MLNGMQISHSITLGYTVIC